MKKTEPATKLRIGMFLEPKFLKILPAKCLRVEALSARCGHAHSQIQLLCDHLITI